MSAYATAPTLGATFAPLTARPAGPASYVCSDPDAAAAWLEYSRGWTRATGRSAYELARLTRDGALIVVYHSGTALVQGRNPALAHQVLGELGEGGQQ